MINKSDDGTTRVLSLSYGKDSMACLGAIEELGWTLDRIITADVWATDTISADLPLMVEFKEYADKEILRRYGIEVEHFCARKVRGKESKKTYNDVFYRVRVKSKTRNGEIYGFPVQVHGNWCTGELKQTALREANRSIGDCVQYIGIAADEPNRFHNLSDVKLSPLVEIGWTESDCRKWCEKEGLLSPIYTQSARGGCWFCHNQGVGQLRLLRKQYPDLWALLLKWDSDSPVSFKADGHTVHDYDKRFRLEDDGFLSPDDKNFTWGMIDGELNFRLF